MAVGDWSVAEKNNFRTRLLKWYDASRRDLPWRRTQDPYCIWVSEIMLQQTRVAAVLEHYVEFLRRFPAVTTLAQAAEADVLAAWSGLGYYRRARMLHRGAQAVVREHQGVVPSTAAALLTLPGIGAYTSAAIASIAFGEAIATIDGNVERVILRLTGPVPGTSARGTVTQVRQAADSVLDKARPGDSNQAMMELGATVCLPRKPLCLQCPVAVHCGTRGEHPVTPRKASVRRDIAVALVTESIAPSGTLVLLQRRPVEGTVMSGMWELPEIPIHVQKLQGAAGLVVRHSIMRTNYFVQVYAMDRSSLSQHAMAIGHREWVATEALQGFALTGLARKILRKTGLMVGVFPQSGSSGKS